MSRLTTTTASKRFETTAKSAQAYIHSLSTTASALLQPHSRTIPTHANTKTNWVLGTDRVLYETDAMARQKGYQKAGMEGPEGEREAFYLDIQKQKAENRALKRALTATHFTLADNHTINKGIRGAGMGGEYRYQDESDAGDWEEEEEEDDTYGKRTTVAFVSSSSSPYSAYSTPIPAAGACIKDRHNKTHFSLGTDKNDYSSSSRDMNHLIEEEEAVREEGKTGEYKKEYEARRLEVAAMREALTRTHITFGDEGRKGGGGKGQGREGSAYTTQYQDVFRPKTGMQSPSTFEFPTHKSGLPFLPWGRLLDEGEKVDYTTTSMALMGKTPLPEAQERNEAVMRARAMKTELMRSHADFALDPEYL